MAQKTVLDKFFEDLGKKGKGRFLVITGGRIRHQNPEWPVCPIEFLYARKAHRSLRQAYCGALDTMIKNLGLGVYEDQILDAADSSTSSPTRTKMLQVLGLE